MYVTCSLQFELEEYNGVGEILVLSGQTADAIDILGVYKNPDVEINANTIFLIKNVGAYMEVFYSEFSGKVDIGYIIIK